jgi:hypothetical protein
MSIRNFFSALLEYANLLNSAGVFFASAGSILVWRYLTEISFVDKEAYLRGQGVLTVPMPSKSDIPRFKRSMGLSRLGIRMILIGGYYRLPVIIWPLKSRDWLILSLDAYA